MVFAKIVAMALASEEAAPMQALGRAGLAHAMQQTEGGNGFCTAQVTTRQRRKGETSISCRKGNTVCRIRDSPGRFHRSRFAACQARVSIRVPLLGLMGCSIPRRSLGSRVRYSVYALRGSKPVQVTRQVGTRQKNAKGLPETREKRVKGG
jgi:hypothetical protein